MSRCLGLAVLFAATLISPTLAAKSKQPRLPPYAGAYQPQGIDERGLWMEADEDERRLRDSNFVVNDPALQTYVRRILCDAVGSERCAGVRLYIVRMPEFNASMTPNGTMRIFTGLLLRVRSEAELAAVLAHEFAHFEERHSLSGFKRARSASDIAMWAGLLGGANASAVQLAVIGGIYSFNRDQERAADIRGFAYLSASRFRPGAFADIWRRQMDEMDATAAGRKQRSTRYDRSAFFASHPTSLERATYLRQMATKDGDDGEDAETVFREALAKWRPAFLADQLKLNDFAGTEYLLAQLAGSGWSPDLLVARGDLYRTRGNPRDLVSAAGFYRDAIAGGSADPAARRGLGLALMRSGSADQGRQILLEYLALRPTADDAMIIRTLVEQ